MQGARAHSLGFLDTLRDLFQGGGDDDGVKIGGVSRDDDPTWGLVPPEDVDEAESLVNYFASRAGYDRIPPSGDFGAEQAQRAVEAYLWVIDRYMGDQEKARRIRDDMLSAISEHGIGRFFEEHGGGVLDRLAIAKDGIESGELQPMQRQLFGLDVKRAAFVGAALIGVAWMIGEAA